MGCICSKGSSEDENVFEQKEVKSSVHMVAPLHREEIKVELVNPKIEIIPKSKRTSESALISVLATKVEDDGKTRIIERPKEGHHKRRSTVDFGVQQSMSRVVSIPNAAKGELGAAGWPSWLTSVAADAIQGWLPRSADSFEKLNKVSSTPFLCSCFIYESFMLFSTYQP